MASIDEPEILALAGAAGSNEVSPWIRLSLEYSVSTASSPSYYLKLLHLASPSHRLVAVLSDLKTGVWAETFESARSVQVRLRVSNKAASAGAGDASSSTAAAADRVDLDELGQSEAVDLLFAQLRDWYGHIGPRATLEVRHDDEIELMVELESLSFRFRMDRLSPPAQMQIIHALLLQPALALIQTLLTAAPSGLHATQEAIDSTATLDHQPDPVLLAAVQRYAQAARGTAEDARQAIRPLERKPIASAKKRKSETKQPERAASGRTPSPITAHEQMDIDPDATVDSARADSPSPAKRRKSASRSPTPDPDATVDSASTPASTRKRKERHGVRGTSPRAASPGGDSDATQASDGESGSEPVHQPSSGRRSARKKAIARSPTPEVAEQPQTPPAESKKAPVEGGPIPAAPVPSGLLMSPQQQGRGGSTAAARARGRGRGRGAAGQWTRFG